MQFSRNAARGEIVNDEPLRREFGGDERTRVRNDGHSERVAVRDFAAQLFTAELKVRNTTGRRVPDELFA
jgi:hypothetical protein